MMMKFILFMVFLIPLSFNLNYWLIHFYLGILMFLFLMKINLSYFYCYLSLDLGVDFLSYWMIILSIWISILMCLASMKIYKEKNFSKLFISMILLLLLFLMLTFLSINMFLFYIFFESSLIPILFMLMGWGYQPERIQAGVYLIFYTMFASLPMMLGLFFIYLNNESLSWMLLKNMNNLILYICMNLVFFVKMPMFIFHLWLPKAHVEAPIAGSMMLAGVMLKLGGYGMMRLLKIFMEIGLKFNVFLMSISLLGGMLVSLICIRQNDLKSLVAYSSVAHMSLVLVGLFTFNYWGFIGALIMMLGHGLSSSGLFCLLNISFERLNSRSIYLNKGLMNIMPSMSMWWFLICVTNMAAPPSLNLMGEIFLITSLVSFSNLNLLMLMIMSFFSAVYSLYLYSYTQHGKIFNSLYSFMMGYIREFLLLFLHWMPLNFLILNLDLFNF
uniref:NADH-ubiquinone oxidoreductase chain 4 n=1 Tax=Discolomatidae sp. 4 ACP-2013 TaxID=1434487 RepID=A0A3G3FWV2_9CUCU|nr:NADH dehydrogenase subunit 4 [Discolomatidae sp. 4 ACP-2013]